MIVSNEIILFSVGVIIGYFIGRDGNKLSTFLGLGTIGVVISSLLLPEFVWGLFIFLVGLWCGHILGIKKYDKEQN